MGEADEGKDGPAEARALYFLFSSLEAGSNGFLFHFLSQLVVFLFHLLGYGGDGFLNSAVKVFHRDLFRLGVLVQGEEPGLHADPDDIHARMPIRDLREFIQVHVPLQGHLFRKISALASRLGTGT